MIPNLPLVSLAQARLHARTEEDQDTELLAKISLASGIVMNYCKLTEIPNDHIQLLGDESPVEEINEDDVSVIADGSPPTYYHVPSNIQAAVLLVLSELYANHESSSSNPISPAVVSLLTPYRDPTFA